MDTRAIRTIEDLLAEVAALEGRETAGQGAARVSWWFRGQRDAGHDLCPAILRPGFLEAARRARGAGPPELAGLQLERALLRDFRIEAAPHLVHGAEPTTLYLTARHHGLPTRLLDWSLSPLVACFFAAQQDPAREPCDGAVFALDVGAALGGPVTERSPELRAAIERCYAQDERELSRADDAELARAAPPDVIAFVPDARGGRLFAQKAVFTLHPPGARELAEHVRAAGNAGRGACRKLVVPAERKDELRGMLRRLGIDWSTLFPDVDHLVRELLARSRLAPSDETAP